MDNQSFKLLKTEYASYANVSIAGLINAIGALPDYWAINSRGTREFRSEQKLYNANREYRLTTNAGLLYLYLHLLGPSNTGNVTINLEVASDYLKRSKRTVYNNLKILRRKHYINFIPGLLEGTYDVYIEYYESNKLAAKNPSNGFIVLSKTLFDKLISIKDINAFRFSVRGLLNQVPGKQNSGIDSGCTFKEIKQIFPTYMSRKMIMNVLHEDAIAEIFNISASKTFNYFKVHVKGAFDTLSLKRKKLLEIEAEIKNTFERMNAKYPDNQFKPSKQELRDISKISLQKPISGIKQAIYKLFANYTRKTVNNMPALVRSLIT